MRKLLLAGAVAAIVVLIVAVSDAAPTGQGASARTFEVLYDANASLSAARAAVTAAGGTIVDENRAIGLATVTTSNPDFVDAVRSAPALDGAARNRPVGRAIPDAVTRRDAVERLAVERLAARGRAAKKPKHGPKEEPFAFLQWDMRQIRATPEGSYGVERGSDKVLVGIIDTGVDGTHPDIAPNFDKKLSRNFVTDIPLIDGPCEVASCVDPANVDEDSHGTHVAGTIGAAINDFGIAGVAPKVGIVNVRAGQDSGFFFLQPTIDALTYAGDVGIDVVNMSYYIDPWLYNCASNPADSPDAQLEQRTIIAATQRALDYARARGVTLVSALGNENTDLNNPTFDDTSPDFPPGTEYERTVDNSCVDLPVEADGVIGVSATGPSTRKAYYSNWGTEQTDVAAPGGDFRDFFGTPQYRTPENLVLAPYPKNVAEANGELEPDGTPNTPFVLEDCKGAKCAYYQYLQGTSMASPHAAGVAALIVSRWGSKDRAHTGGGLTLAPAVTQAILEATATQTPCPDPPLFIYPDRPPAYNALCEGPPAKNGFYGHGIVDALRAVAPGR